MPNGNKKKMVSFTAQFVIKNNSSNAYAIACERSHDLIYVPFKKEDLFRLIQFIMTGDRDLLSENLVKTIFKYKSGEYK